MPHKWEWQALRPLPPLAALSRTTPAAALSPGWLAPEASVRLYPATTGQSDASAAYLPLVPGRPIKLALAQLAKRSETDLRRQGRKSRPGLANRTELVLATPDWLYCLVGRWQITAGWPSLRPNSICAVLHLVESRSQFGSFELFSKSNRPYLMRAFGHWHLDEPPPPSPLRAVRLSAALWEATGESTTLHPLLTALQALAVVAAVTGRTPLIPQVPCSSHWLHRNPMTLMGVSDDYVMQLHAGRGANGRVECHLSMGGKRCALPAVLPAWYSTRHMPSTAFGASTLAAHPAAGEAVDEARAPVLSLGLGEERLSPHVPPDAGRDRSSAEKAAARGGACGDGSVGKLRLGLAELRAAASNGERTAPCRGATA